VFGRNASGAWSQIQLVKVEGLVARRRSPI
jgi:hypothetical protein